MTVLRAILLLGLFASLLPVAGRAAAPEVPMANRWYQMTITVEKNSELVIAVFPQEIGGNIAFCGAYWPGKKGGFAASRSSQLFDGIIIEVRGRVVPANLRVFRDHPSQQDVRKATCAVTGKPWQGPYAEDDIVLRLRGRFIRD